jgi:DNA repair exonuclease SbcCD nuclease subunit
MRIAALGDAHLGRSAYTATTPEGVNQREADFEGSFEAAVDLALEQSPDVLVWLGDVFDHPRPTYRSFRVVQRALAKIRAHGLPLVAISGNHDTPRLPGTGNPYAVLADAFPELHFVYRLGYERIDLPGVVVHAVPQTRTAEDAVDALRQADRNRANDVTNLLITHPLVIGVERRYADVNEIEVEAAELRSDLVLLGHYHTMMPVPGRPRVWYAGATDTFGFGDDPDRAKGIVVLDTETGRCRHVPLRGQRRLARPDPVYAFGLSAAEVQSIVVDRLAQIPGGAVTRLELDGVEPETYRLLDLAAIGEASRHLLHVRLEPRFDATKHPVNDLPELSTLGARWRSYVATQPTDGFDPERLVTTGDGYLQAAIETVPDGPAE